MKEIFLKVLFVVIAGVIAVPLLVSLWPKDTVVMKRDTALTNAVIVPDDWVEYNNNDLKLNFWYPPELSQSTSVTISGFSSVEATLVTTLSGSKNTTELGNDAPFDGFSVYAYDLAAENTDVTFEELIGAEKISMKEDFQTLNGTNSDVPPVKEESLTLGEHTVIKLTSPSKMTHYYLDWKDGQILQFSTPRSESDPFITILEDILKTVESK